jgi:hypothetical protein
LPPMKAMTRVRIILDFTIGMLDWCVILQELAQQM